MTTKRKPTFTRTATMTATPAELAYHRQRIDEQAVTVKTAVRIDGSGKRKVVRRRK